MCSHTSAPSLRRLAHWQEGGPACPGCNPRSSPEGSVPCWLGRAPGCRAIGLQVWRLPDAPVLGVGVEPCSEEGAESSRALNPELCPVVGHVQPKQCLATPTLQMEKLRPREVRGLFQSHTARWRRHSRFRVDLENPWRPEPHFPESPGRWHPCLRPVSSPGEWAHSSHVAEPSRSPEAPASSRCLLPLLPTPSTQRKGSDPTSKTRGPLVATGGVRPPVLRP